MKRPRLRRPSLPKRSKSDEAPKPKRPGVFDTMRDGWLPAEMRLTGTKGAPAGAARTAGKAGAADGTPTVGQPVTRPELAKQRDRLARQFAELQWDLGGIAYEMASRDHFRMDVLVKQAAKLQEVDSQLGQVERVLRLDQEGAAGTCPYCGSLQARGAVFCWHCGKELKPEAKPSQAPKPAEAKATETTAAEAKPAETKAGSA